MEINSIPQEVTAGQSFTLSGRVLDGFEGNRSVTGPMAIEVFFLNDSSETLVSSHTTTNNGSFSVSVPTDPFGDGVSSGTKTIVVSVIEGSSPFYLTGTGNASILVTVSYTHLRAHETREDLVCRLLLEKKKKKTQ